VTIPFIALHLFNVDKADFLHGYAASCISRKPLTPLEESILVPRRARKIAALFERMAYPPSTSPARTRAGLNDISNLSAFNLFDVRFVNVKPRPPPSRAPLPRDPEAAHPSACGRRIRESRRFSLDVKV